MLTRRSILAAPAFAAGAAALPSASLARAPLADSITPPVYRFKVGSAEVTALADGILALGPELFPAAQRNAQEAAQLLRQSALTSGPIPTFVNAYVVNTGERLVLVDTGTGHAMGPTLGHLPKTLAAAGMDPAAIDAVILTHMHPDHVGGLSPQGAAFFPNAEIVVAEADYAFWTDEGTAARAPADAQPFFRLARESVRPYANRLRRVGQAAEVLPGISLESAPGHTPGHSMVRLAQGSSQLLIWGDIVHAAALQFDQPDWSIAFDTDPAKAAETRRRVFDAVAADRHLVAGMHLPFPGVGYVTRAGTAYRYVPQLWPPTG